MKRQGSSSRMLERRINSEIDRRINSLFDRKMKSFDLESRFKSMLQKSQRSNMTDFNRNFFGAFGDRVSQIPIGSISDSQFMMSLSKEIQNSIIRNF